MEPIPCVDQAARATSTGAKLLFAFSLFLAVAVACALDDELDVLHESIPSQAHQKHTNPYATWLWPRQVSNFCIFRALNPNALLLIRQNQRALDRFSYNTFDAVPQPSVLMVDLGGFEPPSSLHITSPYNLLFHHFSRYTTSNN